MNEIPSTTPSLLETARRAESKPTRRHLSKRRVAAVLGVEAVLGLVVAYSLSGLPLGPHAVNGAVLIFDSILGGTGLMIALLAFSSGGDEE